MRRLVVRFKSLLGFCLHSHTRTHLYIHSSRDDVVRCTHTLPRHKLCTSIWVGKPFSVSCQVAARAALSVMPARWFVTYKSVKISMPSFRLFRSLRSRSCHLFDWTVSLFAQQSYLFLCKFHLAPLPTSQLCAEIKLWSLSFPSLLVVAYAAPVSSLVALFRSVVIWCWRSAVNLSILFFLLPTYFLSPAQNAFLIGFKFPAVPGKPKHRQRNEIEFYYYRARHCTEVYNGIFFIVSHTWVKQWSICCKDQVA